MPPHLLIPRPDTLQVGWGWFQVLLTLTFSLHILLMNAMFGGAVVTLTGAWRRGGPGAPAARDMAGRVPTLVALAVNAGVAPLLFLQVLYGHLFYTSSILMARWWLAVIPALIVAYYAVYVVYFRYETPLGRVGSLLAIGLLLYVSFTFASNSTLALTPARWTAGFENPSGAWLNLAEPTLWPRWLHMVVGAVAVGGLFAALIQDGRARRGIAGAAAARDWALRFFTHGSLIQMAIGLWWLMTLPEDVMHLFMGRRPLASGLLIAGIAAGIWAVVLGFQKKLKSAAAWLVATVAVMAVLREIVRFGYLEGVFHPGQLTVSPQVSPLILFLAVLAVGIGCVAYMLKLALRADREG